MTDKKFTDEEIIKALECCLSTTTEKACIKCPFNKNNLCDKDQWALERYALDLINRQKSAIERLNGSTIVNNIMESQRIKREAKAEAYKEFAERIRECCASNDDLSADEWLSITTDIDCVLKEMVGEEE